MADIDACIEYYSFLLYLLSVVIVGSAALFVVALVKLRAIKRQMRKRNLLSAL